MKKQKVRIGMYVLATTQYGSEMFVSDKSLTDMPVTDNIKEALVFDNRDNPDTKLHTYRSLMGYDFVVKHIDGV